MTETGIIRALRVGAMGDNRISMVAGIHMECEICGAQPGQVCISMAKRYSGDYGCRGRAISLAAESKRERKTLHKERAIAAAVESERRRRNAAEYNRSGI